MKKRFSLILLCIFVLSLAACGDAPIEPSVGDQMYEKYQSIIDNLEAGEYEAVIEEVSGMMPEPEEVIVDITPENFYDYYEIVFDNNYLTKDANGTVTSIWGNNSFSFKLKDKYMEAFIPKNANIEIGLTSEVVIKKIEDVDWKTGEFTLSKENYDEIESEIASQFFPEGSTSFEDISTTYSGENFLFGNIGSQIGMGFFYPYHDSFGTYWRQGEISVNESYGELYIAVPENINVIRAEGQLTLRR